MKLLVTGARGQVGSEVVKLCEQRELTYLATGSDDLDITNSRAVADTIEREQPTLVINAAAYTAVDRAEQEPELAYAVNRDGAKNLALACVSNNVPLLHISTDYVFDGKKQEAYTEQDAPNPTGVYGKSKLEAELTIAGCMDHHYILRVAWVFGESGHNFVRTMLQLGSERDEIGVVADQLGGPTCAKDIALTLLHIVRKYHEKQPMPWGTYHYTGKPAVTWYEFAGEIFDQAQQLGLLNNSPIVNAISTAEYPTPARRPQNSLLNCNKIVAALDINQPDWKEGLKDVLKSWKKSNDL